MRLGRFRKNLVPVALAVVFAVFTAAAQGTQPMMQQKPMMGDMMDAPMVPPVMGYAEGEQAIFLHTETSNPEIAKILTDIVVPSLAAAPEQMTASVYVFTNGFQPAGPRGPLNFQPDVFDSPPGNSGYSPIRAVTLVTWGDGVQARLLTSAPDAEEAIRRGELATEEPGVVVNMPLLTWPSGQR